MSDQSSNLALSYVQPAQAQKHIAVNETTLRLDALVQLAVESHTLSAQPISPVDGARYILPPGKTGAAWGAMANGAIAYWRDGAWEPITPREGFLAYVRDVDHIRSFDGAAWRQEGADRVAKAGDAMTGPLALPANGLTVGSSQFVIKSGRIGIATADPIESASVHVARNQRDLVWLGAPYNGGVATTEGDVRLGIGAWTGRPEILFARHHVNTAMLALSSAGAFELSTGGAVRFQVASDGAVLPALANATPLGSASLPWSNIFSQNAVTVTSDARAKTDIAPCALGLDFICALRPVSFRHRSGGMIETPGATPDDPPSFTVKPGVRMHTGFLAQDVRAALPDGLDWAGWCLADKADPESAQALRYEALLVPLVKAVQELSDQVRALQA